MKVFPPVTVVIPVHGRASTLKDAIESVFLQNYQGDIELIVIDDASPAFVSDCLIPYRNRIKYFKLGVNSGVSFARNYGIAQAAHDYIAFLDSDDVFLPSKINRQMLGLWENGLKISHTNELWYKSDKFINQGKKYSRYGGDIFSKALDICRVSPSSLLVHKEVFGSVGVFDETLRVCEDYEWTLRCALKYSFDYIEERLLIKRAVEENSLSASIKYIESIRLEILKNFEKKYGWCLDEERAAALGKELKRKNSIVKQN